MTKPASLDTLHTRQTFAIGGLSYDYFSLRAVEKELGDLSRLPCCLKILLENLLRYDDGHTITFDMLQSFSLWLQLRRSDVLIPFRPSRLLMDDQTALPVLGELASMRDALHKEGRDPERVQPQIAIDLTVVPAEAGTFDERLDFLNWASQNFQNLSLIPTASEISPQISLSLLGQIISTDSASDGATMAYPDSFLTSTPVATQANGLGIFGWRSGCVETQTLAVGLPVTLALPEVVGIRLTGAQGAGVTGSLVAVALTQLLRRKGLQRRCVEFYGPGVASLSVQDRALLSAATTAQGALCGLFPIDANTIAYMEKTKKSPAHIGLVQTYAENQGLWFNPDQTEGAEPLFTETMDLDLSSIEAASADLLGPQDQLLLKQMQDLCAANEAAIPSLCSRESLPLLPMPGTTMSPCYPWHEGSFYLTQPPFFDHFAPKPPKVTDIQEARLIALFGDKVSAEMIAPMDAIPPSSDAGRYLIANGVDPEKLDTYLSRRAHYGIVVRGVLSGSAIANELVPGQLGPITRHFPSGQILSFYEASRLYFETKTPVIIVAGKNFGDGQSCHWTGKGLRGLNVKAVLAESFDPAMRGNLARLGILPLEFKGGVLHRSLALTGEEVLSIAGPSVEVRPRMDVILTVTRHSQIDRFVLCCRLDTAEEVEYFRHGGMLNSVLRRLYEQEKP